MKNEQRMVAALLARRTALLCGVGVASFALLGCAGQVGSEGSEAARASLTGVSGNNWMSALDPDLSLSQLSLPGTHDSMARFEPVWGTAACQNLVLGDQLNVGVRYVDIRCRHINNAFAIHHGSVYQNANFNDVLDAAARFLSANPSEAIIMSVKEEYNATGDTRSFEQTFDTYVAQNPGLWNLGAGVPTIRQGRGKITLLRRFGAGGLPKGIDATSWGDNTSFVSSNLYVQDSYAVGSNGTKWNQISTLLGNAYSGSPSNLYLNYTSGYQSFLGIPNIPAVSNTINPKLSSYFSSSPQGRYGAVAVDFVDSNLASLIYNENSAKLNPGALVFDAGDKRRTSTTGDWDPTDYKAECGPDQAAIGLSASASTVNAHGLLCSRDAPGLAHDGASGCHPLNFEQNDSGVTSDWDFGFFKGQCAANEFVAGVSVIPGGGVHDLLCCPGSVTQANCATLGNDRGDNREPGAQDATGDWDFGNLKGECAPGRYIAGVSHYASGQLHAILCCSR
jgi:phosphatidylinositol-specific phospholipase C-like protein